MAPYDVVLFDCRARRRSSPTGAAAGHSAGERTAKSAGTDALVDERGVASSGTVSVVDLDAGKELAQIVTGLHPSDLELSPDGNERSTSPTPTPTP